jgi:hypothetical protein
MKFHTINTKTGRESAIQRSTVVWTNLNPVWNPPEQFVFCMESMEDLDNTRLICDVIDYDKYNQNDYLGTCMVVLKHLPLLKEGAVLEQQLDLLDKETNNRIEGPKVFVQLAVKPSSVVESTHHETVYEYERWTPIGGWGKSMLPTDKGCWSNGDFSEWGSTMAAVESVHIGTQDGRQWASELGWAMQSSGGNSEGWWFAVDLGNREWVDKAGTLHCVRRRKWVRTSTVVAAAVAVEDS